MIKACLGPSQAYTSQTRAWFRRGLWFRLGERPPIAARFEEGHRKEEKMAAVHYLRFSVPRGARAALADPHQTIRLVVDHPGYRAEAEIPAAARAELLADLRA